MKNINIIALVDNNYGIGYKGDQLIYIYDDLKRFKDLTYNHTVVMGRKTCEALPVQYLPNRRNIILTHNINYERAGCEIFNTVDDLLNNINDNEKVFIIGGGKIYKLFLSLANKIYLTVVNYKFENVDTYFPNINDEWKLSRNTDLMMDSESNLNFKYKIFKRK